MLLAWHFWNTRWRRQPGGGLRGWERAAILAPLAVHGWLLYEGIFAAAELRFGFAQALSVMMFLGVALYWIEGLFYNLEGMQPVVLTLAAIVAPLPALFPGLASSGAHAQAGEFKLHLALAMVAYSLAVIALLSWLTFGWLLAGRWRYGWRGRTAVRWTLGGFVLLVLAYVGSRFVLEVLLGRG